VLCATETLCNLFPVVWWECVGNLVYITHAQHLPGP
jgi:hypothetical protein